MYMAKGSRREEKEEGGKDRKRKICTGSVTEMRESRERKPGQLRISTACAEFAGIIDFIKSM